jgi:hypothetical protein
VAFYSRNAGSFISEGWLFSPGLCSEEAVVAIHQGSGGLLRRANSLARVGLIAAARENRQLVSAEHVRLAATEIL